MNSPWSSKDVLNTMKTIGVIPVLHNADVNNILQAIKICYRCGAHVFEFLHQRDNRGLRIFTWLVEQTASLPDLRLGVGTVLDATMTDRYIKAGAKFISSPFLRKDMGDVCRKADVMWMPGCSSQEDIHEAMEYGASAVMLLPGNVLKPEFLRKAVIDYAGLSFVPSGDIDLTEESLKSWIWSGAMAVRLGDPLFPRDMMALQNWDRINTNACNAVQIVHKLRTSPKKNFPHNIS